MKSPKHFIDMSAWLHKISHSPCVQYLWIKYHTAIQSVHCQSHCTMPVCI